LDNKTDCKNDNENTGMILLQVAPYTVGKLLIRQQPSNYINVCQQSPKKMYFNSEKKTY